MCRSWACSSVGRAFGSHPRGREFESLQVHHEKSSRKAAFFSNGSVTLRIVKLLRKFRCPACAGHVFYASNRLRCSRSQIVFSSAVYSERIHFTVLSHEKHLCSHIRRRLSCPETSNPPSWIHSETAGCFVESRFDFQNTLSTILSQQSGE